MTLDDYAVDMMVSGFPANRPATAGLGWGPSVLVRGLWVSARPSSTWLGENLEKTMVFLRTLPQ
ncbi:MAG TPA: hypothetical protein VIQ62_02450 [Burkholderiales bacterium]